jgi:hypothetical protein
MRKIFTALLTHRAGLMKELYHPTTMFKRAGDSIDHRSSGF